MGKFTLGLIALLWTSVSLAQSLPADVSTRVGRAGEFVYDYTLSQYQNKLSTYDIIWDNRPNSAQGYVLILPSSVFSSGYTAVNRVPTYASPYGTGITILKACGVPSGGCPLAWFRTNHPTWIIYTSDQVTPAYQFGDTTWVPLDISNVTVQSWLETNVYAPILSAGYQSFSIDNVTDRNDWDEVGICSIAPTTNCTADGGTWTQLYSGAVQNDATFINNRVAWGQAVTAWAHTQGKSTMANISYDAANLTDTARLVNAYDIWYDEQGITGDSQPSACTPNNGSGATGTYWINKIAFITGLNGGAGPNAYVDENSICPIGSFTKAGVSTNFEVVEYAAASYLLLKNAHTYMTMYFDSGSAGGPGYYNENTPTAFWPQFYLTHGVASGAYAVTGNVYYRTFASLLALVNPSTTLSRTYDLGASVYHRSDCTRFTGVITIPPITGMVLLNGEPSGCIP